MNDESRTPSITAVDLFCGVGGLTHGLALGGIRVLVGYDIDPACRFPYEANNSATFVQRDVSELTGDEIRVSFGEEKLTLLAGCAPCQPFSTYARKGRSKKGALDWQLVSKFGRLVAEVQPDLVTMENVSQLADHSVFNEFIGQLSGYSVRWSIVECANYGVPQSRRQLVLLASRLGGSGLEMPSAQKDLRTVRDTISDLPEIKAGEQHPNDPLHVASSLSPLNLKRIKASVPGGTWRDWDSALRARCHNKDTGATYPSVYGRMEWDKIAPTITTQSFGYGNGRFGHPEQDRAISLRESAMLQTFPRDYKFTSQSERVTFSKLGRLIGNAVPVTIGEVIAQVLLDHVQISRQDVSLREGCSEPLGGVAR